jgi:hypothetical protein
LFDLFENNYVWFFLFNLIFVNFEFMPRCFSQPESIVWWSLRKNICKKI